jgi:hypothetical protein
LTTPFAPERTKSPAVRYRELSGPRTYQSFIESQTLCIARRARHTASFVEFLREQTTGGAQASLRDTGTL